MTPRSRFAVLALSFLVLVLALGAPSLPAQISTGSILGTVTDPSGAVVPDATVTVTSVSTGASRTIKTTESGSYSASALLPGAYLLTYEQPGFGKGRQTITVAVGVTANGDFTMPLASATSSVVVTGDSTVAVNTEQAIVNDVMTTQQIEALPLNGEEMFPVRPST
jgi:hypothetical protein